MQNRSSHGKFLYLTGRRCMLYSGQPCVVRATPRCTLLRAKELGRVSSPNSSTITECSMLLFRYIVTATTRSSGFLLACLTGILEDLSGVPDMILCLIGSCHTMRAPDRHTHRIGAHQPQNVGHVLGCILNRNLTESAYSSAGGNPIR